MKPSFVRCGQTIMMKQLFEICSGYQTYSSSGFTQEDSNLSTSSGTFGKKRILFSAILHCRAILQIIMQPIYISTLRIVPLQDRCQLNLNCSFFPTTDATHLESCSCKAIADYEAPYYIDEFISGLTLGTLLNNVSR